MVEFLLYSRNVSQDLNFVAILIFVFSLIVFVLKLMYRDENSAFTPTELKQYKFLFRVMVITVLVSVLLPDAATLNVLIDKNLNRLCDGTAQETTFTSLLGPTGDNFEHVLIYNRLLKG